MRGYDGSLELRPSLIGTLSVGLTAVGAPVDTLGFSDVLAVLIAGSVYGTNGNVGYLDVKIQESATATGTGANWSDITDGAVHAGSFDFDQMTFAANTNPNIQMAKQYDHLGLGRKRYIRAHATVSGTDSCSPKLSVAFLLGRPTDTLYINNAVLASSTNVEYSKCL